MGNADEDDVRREREMAWALLVFALWVWVIRVGSLLLHKAASLFLILLLIDRAKRKKKEEAVGFDKEKPVGFAEGAKRKEEDAVGFEKKEPVGFVEGAERKMEAEPVGFDKGFDKEKPVGFVEGAKRKKEAEAVGFDKKEPVFGTSSSAIGSRQMIWVLIGIYLCFWIIAQESERDPHFVRDVELMCNTPTERDPHPIVRDLLLSTPEQIDHALFVLRAMHVPRRWPICPELAVRAVCSLMHQVLYQRFYETKCMKGYVC